MEYQSFADILAKRSLFSDIASWRISEIRVGISSPNKYEFQKDGHDLFVKEVQPHERDILLSISGMNLRHVPIVKDRDLLKDSMILVTDFSPNGTLKSFSLSLTLFDEMVQIQNLLSRKEQPQSAERDSHRDWAVACFDFAAQNISKLKEHLKSPALDEFDRLLDSILPDKQVLSKTYAGMPFARSHNDFMPHNILSGPPQIISDWGSCYGDGPFLFDVAPFLSFSPGAIDIYMSKSLHAGHVTFATFNAWHRSAMAIGLVSFLKFIFERGPASLEMVSDWTVFLDFYLPMFTRKSGVW